MKKKTRQLLFLAILVLFLMLIDFTAIAIYFNYAPAKTDNSIYSTETARVSEIISGDTLRLDNGNIVRLLSIEAPAPGSNLFYDSARLLEFLTVNKTIKLERDKQDKDDSGRLLRYVYVEYNGKEVFINAESVRIGLSLISFTAQNINHKSEIESAREECLRTKLNLCA